MVEPFLLLPSANEVKMYIKMLIHGNLITEQNWRGKRAHKCILNMEVARKEKDPIMLQTVEAYTT